jgi:hypothetical protein
VATESTTSSSSTTAGAGKINNGFGVGFTSAVGHYLPVANSRLLEVQRVAR